MISHTFRYTHFDGKAAGIQLKYQNAFSDTLWSFATLFQLMTLDHWLETLLVEIYSSIVHHDIKILLTI